MPQTARKSAPYLLYIAGAAVVTIAVLMALAVLLIFIVLSDERIPNGVSIAGLSVGGQTSEQLERQLARTFAAQPLMLVDIERSWQVTTGDLGIAIDTPYMVAAALAAEPDSALTPQFVIDLNQAQSGLVNVGAMVNVEASAAAAGRSLEIPVVLDRLRLDVTGEIADGILELSMIEIAPPTSIPASTPYTGDTSAHIVQAGEELGLIARRYNVSLTDLVSMNGITDPNLIYEGQELIIPAAGIYAPSAADAPAAPTNTGRSLLVSVSSQRLYAYENGQLVHSQLVSTGLPETPTVLGDYAVYVKYTATDMSGPGYYLPQVPYTMYFYQGYGIHGTYWHNNFGRPMSHGCVNLPVEEAAWFFNFAEVGTPVRVIA
jgi:lipoprotein-anchoring transpeptidase ErfK/SrfK